MCQLWHIFSLFFCLQVYNTETKINRKLCPRRWFYKNVLMRAGSFSFPSHLFRPAVEKLVGNALTSRYSRTFPQLYGERKLKKILPRIGFRSTLPYDRMERGADLKVPQKFLKKKIKKRKRTAENESQLNKTKNSIN